MKKRFVCVRSRDSMGCGAAALATVARHYKLSVSPGILREQLATDLDGTSLFHLRQVAQNLGFSASCGRAKSHRVDELPLPAIVHFSDTPVGHFVVIHEIQERSVTIADPARGIVKLPRSEFLRRWTSYVLLLAPSSTFRCSKQKNSPFAELLSVAMKERKTVYFSLALALLTVGFGFTISFSTQRILDAVIPHSDLQLLSILTIGTLMVIAFRSAGLMLRQLLLARLGYKMETALCLPYLQHVLSLPLSFFDKRATGDIFSRTNDVGLISTAISGPVVSALPDMLLLILSALILFWYNADLTLIIFGFIPVLGIIVLMFLKPLAAKESEIKEYMSEWANRFIESLQNIKTLKAFAGEIFAYERTKQPYLKMQERIKQRKILSDGLGTIGAFLTGSASITLLFVGARLVLQSHLKIGQMMFFSSASGLFLGAVDRLAPSINSVQQAIVAIERLREFNAIEPEQCSKQATAFKADHSIKGELEFCDVSFQYGAVRLVLSHIDFKINAGEWVAILGETGSGKTTLANLMLGLYLPSCGDIRINNISIRDVDPVSLRRQFAVVFQEAGLMSGTIRENLMLGNPDASMDEMEEVAKLACIHDFIMSLPKGYDHNVGSLGNLLSGGQRQRIAIARAILRKAPILVLDEATSNLDMCTERKIMQNIKEKRRGQTTIIITHRVPAALLANMVVVLEAGMLVEKGTHAELISMQGGRYQSLWNAFGFSDGGYIFDRQNRVLSLEQ